jgi:hypothetical protein
MDQTIHQSHGLSTLISDTCFRCQESTRVPEDVTPGDAFQCRNCGGWLEVLSRSSDDGKRLSIWLSPIDRSHEEG